MARKNEVIKRILIVVILLTLAFIWGHSMMPGDMSGEESGFVYRVLSPVLKLFLLDAWVTEHLVRKIAHFGEYGALGVELTLYASLYKDLKGQRIGNLICSGLIVAFLDETIQIFSGRGALLSDVLLDFTGAITGIVILNLLMNRIVKAYRSRL